MKARTYQDWQDCGYYVRKGEVSTARDKDGNAVFTREQVSEQNDIGDYLLEDDLFDVDD